MDRIQRKLKTLANMLAYIDTRNRHELRRLNAFLNSITREDVFNFYVINPDSFFQMKRLIYKVINNKHDVKDAFNYISIFIFPDIQHLVTKVNNIQKLRKLRYQLFYKKRNKRPKNRNNHKVYKSKRGKRYNVGNNKRI